MNGAREDWRLQVLEGMGAFNRLVGLQPEAVGQGWCRVVCPIRPEHLNPQGGVHGGMSATLMDVAAGISAIYAGEGARPIVTRSASAHYLRPLKGGSMRAEGRVVKAGRHICLSRVEVYDEEDRLCCVGDFEIFYTD
ncbi:MAG: PaaI family thioesterase [Oscillospiraceae bacterium]|nr:PaaI family thioesterase [Oscillospiraceae bacterium]